MKFVFALLFAFLFLNAAPAEAMSDREVTRSYNGCMQYLKMSVEKQIKIARSTGYTLQQLNWACRLMKKNGLAKSIRLEHEYQRAARSGGSSSGGGGGGSSSHDQGPQRCSFSAQCRGDEHCIDGSCIDRNRQACYPSGLFQCASGEKCDNGACH